MSAAKNPTKTFRYLLRANKRLTPKESQAVVRAGLREFMRAPLAVSYMGSEMDDFCTALLLEQKNYEDF